MSDGSVVFKATANGLVIVFDRNESFEQIYEQIAKKLDSAGFFFQSRLFATTYKGRKLSTEEEEKISRMMAEKTGAKTVIFEIDQEFEKEMKKGIQDDILSSKDSSSQMGAPDMLPSTSGKKSQSIQRYQYFLDLDECMTKFHRGTLRSGKVVSYEGNVVVIGDVNPGAEVEATGNIIVIGTLRGIVHAGASGNKDASVIALNLMPTQLRIADIITRKPNVNTNAKSNTSSFIPEIAYIKNDAILIEKLF